MRQVIRTLLAVVLISATACKADNAVVPLPTEDTVVGTYTLSIINGGPLPFPYSATAASRVDIVSGHITLVADHSFSDEITYRRTFFAGGSDPDIVSTVTGTWSLETNTVTLTFTGHPPEVAIITDNLLSRNDQGLALSYTK